MSLASKITLASTSVGAVAIVAFVHYQQQQEKIGMHKGVLRDMEQQRIKKERQADFDLQKALEEEYRQVQHVADGKGSGSATQGND